MGQVLSFKGTILFLIDLWEFNKDKPKRKYPNFREFEINIKKKRTEANSMPFTLENEKTDFSLDELEQKIRVNAKNGYPPISILLDTEKDKALFHFATAGNDNLFVSKYQLYLPKKEQLEEFIKEEMKQLRL